MEEKRNKNFAFELGPQDKCSSCGTTGLYPNYQMEDMVAELKLPISCHNHAAGCDLSSETAAVLLHELSCEFRPVRCPVLNCYASIAFNGIENHMEERHENMADGKWVIFDVSNEIIFSREGCFIKLFQEVANISASWAPILRNFCHVVSEVRNVDGRSRQGKWRSFAMRSWRIFGTRFFATIMVGGNPSFWHVWVTAATNITVSQRYRAEIRLASSKWAECTAIYYNPGTQ